MTQAEWLLEIACKETIILIAAFAAARMLRRASAATRHFVWAAAFGALLLLLPAIALVPHWDVEPAVAAVVVAGGAPAHGAAPAVDSNPVRPRRLPWLPLWALGCAIAALRFAVGVARTAWIRGRARAAEYAQPQADALRTAHGVRRRVRVLEAPDAPVPLTCGLLRPAILLPGGADAWTEARLATVLRHELAHIQRCDLLAQALGQAACCLYWFHPLAWLAARRLRQERERACDDVVLASGTAPHEYAAALVDTARALARRRQAWSDAPAMAESCDLESRIRILLDPGRNRRPLQPPMAAAICMAVLGLLVPTASLSAFAQGPRGSIEGVVQDPSGARVPGCQVLAKNEDGINEEVTRTDAAGEYRFAFIPPGNYVLEFVAAGFARAKRNTAIKASQPARLDATLEIGSISDRMTIRGRTPASVPPAGRAGTPQRTRVGGNVQPMRLLQRTEPVYPADLQQLGIEGTVLIRAVVSTSGDVLSPKVINTEIDPRLAQLALDAVKQWRYQPSLLNGQPVETRTTLMVEFTLDSSRKSPR